MISSNKRLLGIVAVSLAVFVARALQTAQTTRTSTISDTYNIKIDMHAMDSQECSQAFSRNILSSGYQPIMFTLTNNSEDLLILRTSSITMPLEEASTVIEAAQHPTFWTTFTTTSISAIYFWPAIVPSVGLGLWMSWKNSKMARKVTAAALGNDKVVEIFPYEQVKKVLFVTADAVPSECFFYLFNVHKKSFIPCNVIITQGVS